MNSSFALSEQKPLTQHEANIRSRQIQNVSYKLDFKFEKQKENFVTLAEIRFDLKPKARQYGASTFLDLNDSEIIEFWINEEKILIPNYKKNQLRIPISKLKPKENLVKIRYRRKFTHTGNGLHRFQDPIDQKIYFYSNLEPYYAHYVFPCFDQPDIKASYQVTASAPSSWELIANAPVKSKKKVGNAYIWSFQKTARFSTYLFALHGGPYISWRSRAGKIPLKLYARSSLKKYIDYKEWLQVTRLGLEFYAKAFKYPYPFKKYDQILVPDFNWGAMENVGAVTFSERFAHRSKVTKEMKIDRNDVILHEMAHMWFGNLVTMKWWNDLWLNESFATFAAAWALDRIASKISLDGIWEGFFKDMKQWAYWEDQMPTTHSIEGHVKNTDQAFAAFDGITYGKGAAALKQVFYFMGEKKFSQGLQSYFKEFQFKNTELKDFMQHLSDAAGRNLKSWQKNWLQTSGTNTLRADYECDNGKISHFSLVQGSFAKPKNIYNPLRPHRTQIGFYHLGKKGILSLKETLSAEYSKKRTSVPKVIGKTCPALVFVNEGDYDFSAAEYDEKTLIAIETHLSKIDHPLTRLQLWHSLWNQVYNGKYPVQRYIDLAVNHLGNEKNSLILKDTLSSLVKFGRHAASALLYLPKGEIREMYRSTLENFIFKEMNSAKRGSDIQLLWYQSYLDIAKSDNGKRQIKNWFESEKILPGLKSDQERRWELIIRMANQNLPNARTIIDQEVKKDSSDHGKKQALMAKVSIPNRESKKRWMRRLTEELLNPKKDSLPLPMLKTALSTLQDIEYDELNKEFEGAYFKFLPKLDKAKDAGFMEVYSKMFYPRSCNKTSKQRIKIFLSSNQQLGAKVKKNIKTHIYEMERCLEAHALAKRWEKKTHSKTRSKLN